MYALRNYLIGLNRRWKRLFLISSDALVTLAALFCAAYLHGVKPAAVINPWWEPLGVVTVLVFIGTGFGLYRSFIRYIALRSAFRIALAATATVGALVSLGGLRSSQPYPFPLLVNFGLLLMLGLVFARLIARRFLAHTTDSNAKRILIYGAGQAGVDVARSLESDRLYRVVGFVDDKVDSIGKEVMGYLVYAATKIDAVVERRRVGEVILALPSVSRRRRQEIVAALEPLPVNVRTVPGMNEIMAGTAHVSEIRDIDIEDLLGRNPVPPDQQLLTRSITGKVVMVTGAGGSIGSELCRQIIRLQPTSLVLFESNELALFNVGNELGDLQPRLNSSVIPVLGNVLDRKLVLQCLTSFGVQTLFHAAAYKHVPLVEHNVRAGLRNNVLGTRNVAQAALDAKVERFILISTDKAVRPTNVMGATKRVAELIVQALAQIASRRMENGEPACVFSMVRFGNVLGSSGSVVPLFKAQIQAGGPITVTHPEIRRYFMTIPEAAQLVVQAGAMAIGGEVFVLDMGEPVKIVDLAERMIRLSGCSVRSEANPQGDIEIAFTALRPGEKLYEELLLGENTLSTSHSKIGQARERAIDWQPLQRMLDRMVEVANENDSREVKRLLKQVVPEYAAAQEDFDQLGLLRGVDFECTSEECAEPVAAAGHVDTSQAEINR